MIVPTYGKSDAPVAHAMRTGSLMRRRASRYVHAISAIQTTTRNRMRRFTNRFRPLFVMPKRAAGMSAGVYFVAYVAKPASQEEATEGVAEREEDQDHERDHRRDQGHHA